MNSIDGDLSVRGTLRANSMSIPASAVGDSQVSASSPITSAKLEHQYLAGLAQVHGTAATAERRIVHRAYGAGEVIAVRAGVSVACVGDSTITVDVRKNGVSILTSSIVLDSTNTAFAVEEGAITTDTYAADSCLEVVVTVSAGTGTLGQGLRVDLVLREAAE